MNARIFKSLMASTALGLVLAATPASAQSTQDLLNELKALKTKVETLEKKVEESEKKDAEKGAPGFKIKWEPAPSISSNDGRFEMNVRGRIFADAVFFDDNGIAGKTKTTEFRAARLGLEGKAWNNVKYKFEIDFAGNSVDIKDAYLQLKTGDFKWTFGQHKTPNSLDEQTSSRYITFMERAAFTDAFGLARQLGASVGTGGDSWTFTLGAFRGDANGATDMDLGSTFAGRATWGPTLGNTDTNFHLGTSFRYRMIGDDQGLIRYRQRPFVHATSKRFINTDHIASDDLFFGVEAAVVHGRFAIQSEYAWLWAEIDPGNDPGFSPTSERASFTGGYIDASVFLTDDHRSYDPKKGSFGRVKPSEPLFNGGLGAIQVAYRYDMIDLNDVVSLVGGGTTTIYGGEQNTHILGLNWYWNNYVRWMFNYSHSKITDSMLEASSLVDVNGNNSIDTFSIRAQVDW